MNREKFYSPKSLEMANMLLECGAFDIDVLDVSKKTRMAQNIIVATSNDAESAKQTVNDFCALADEKGHKLYSCDGYNKGDWIVLDYDEVIVHIFSNESRKKYNLEKLWK